MDQRSGVHAIDDDGATDLPDVGRDIHHDIADPSIPRNLKKRTLNDLSLSEQYALYFDADHRGRIDVFEPPLRKPKLRDADHDHRDRCNGGSIRHTRSGQARPRCRQLTT